MIDYLDGQWGEQDQLGWPLSSLGLLRGVTVFDYLRTYDLKPYKVEDHLHRFTQALDELRLEVDERSRLSELIDEAVDRNRENAKELSLRLVVSLDGEDGADYLHSTKSRLAIIVNEVTTLDPGTVNSGLDLATVDFLRPLPHLKHGFYMQPRLAANRQRADDIIYTDKRGFMYEASKSNLFFVMASGDLVTAVVDIYPGVTRKTVIELALDSGVSMEFRPLNITELGNVEEAFLTGTTNEIVPIRSVDEHSFEVSMEASLTSDLSKLLKNYISEQN